MLSSRLSYSNIKENTLCADIGPFNLIRLPGQEVKTATINGSVGLFNYRTYMFNYLHIFI